MKCLHVLYDIVYASMVLLLFHLNVSTLNRCYLYLHRQNRLAYSVSSNFNWKMKWTNISFLISIWWMTPYLYRHAVPNYGFEVFLFLFLGCFFFRLIKLSIFVDFFFDSIFNSLDSRDVFFFFVYDFSLCSN